MDHLAIEPDGTVWIASTASQSDNEHLRGFQVWALGRPGVWGLQDGVPEHISFLQVAPDGTLWAVGSSVATFDGHTWTSPGTSPYRVAAPDGTLWLIHPESGIEAWDGTTSTRYLRGSQINEIALAPDGAIWAVGSVGPENGGVYVIRPETD
jgi:hypothetical protein